MAVRADDRQVFHVAVQLARDRADGGFRGKEPVFVQHELARHGAAS